MIEIIALIVGIILCICLSAFFSASEMAVSSCNKMRLENLKDEGDKRAKTAFRITEHFDDALSAILIGNNLVNIAASSMGSVLVILLLNTDAFTWISTVVITCLVIIFGETIPKIAAKKNATRFSLAFGKFINFLMIILKPVIFLVVKVVSLITGKMKGEDDELDNEEAIEELSSIIETAEDEAVLEEDQSELVQAAIDFLDISAYEAMTSRVDLVAIDIDDDWDNNLRIIEDSAYSRIPVYEGSIDNIIGILYMNHVLKALTEENKIDLRSLLMEPVYVYKTTKLTTVLDQLRAAKQHMAIVCNEYGGTHGVITMEDIMEEIVGDIWDETDVVEEEVKEISETVFELDGDMVISDFCELLGIDEESFETESDTIGGWCLEHFELYPLSGDHFHDDELCLSVTIMSIIDRRVEKILVIKDDKEENDLQ